MRSSTPAMIGLVGTGICLWTFLLVHRTALSQDTPQLPPDCTPAAATHSNALVGTADSSTAYPTPGDSSPTEAAGCVNVNTIDEEGLTKLPGIGPVIAARIVAYREANGYFSEPTDLRKIKGIGPAKVDKIKNLICF